MLYLWLIFVLVPVIMFASFCYVGSVAEKNTKIDSQQKWKVIWGNTFHWVLLDLVYMAIFNQWMTWIFIFGSIVIIKVLYTITKVFLQKEEKQSFIVYSIIVDFIIGIGLSVYLIFIIENAVLQSIITTVIAAVYGGLLTLVGVAWTIKKADRDRKEEDKKKYRPIVNFYNQLEEVFIKGKFFDGSAFKDMSNDPFLCVGDKKTAYTLHNLICANTDFSQFYLSGIIINESIFYSNMKLYVDKNEKFGFDTQATLYSENEIKRISLIVQDLLGNEYKLPTKFEIIGIDNKFIHIKDVGFVCDINTEECDERF